MGKLYLLKDLPKETAEKIAKCKTQEELERVLQEEGIKLTGEEAELLYAELYPLRDSDELDDDELEVISAGAGMLGRTSTLPPASRYV